MKFIILSVTAFAAYALASEVPDVQDLAARSRIDPNTVNPTKLAVLAALKTAVPSGDFPHPTGEVKPEWVKNLPAEVASMLPKLYPAANVSSNATSKPSCITSTITKTLQYASTGTAVASRTTATNGTLKTGTPTPTGSGTKTAMNLEALAALAWVGLGAGFFLFA